MTKTKAITAVVAAGFFITAAEMLIFHGPGSTPIFLIGKNIGASGSTSSDEIYGERGNDRIAGFSGGDYLDGGGGDDVLISENGADALVGGAGNDRLSSGDGDDYLIGDEGDDVLAGGDGDDMIEGGSGNDRLEGGSGNDRFVFNSPLDASSNVDTIADYSPANDSLLLASSVFTALAAGPLPEDALHAGTAAARETDRIIYDAGSGWLTYDADGTGAQAAVHFATISPGLALSSADFSISGR
ncbi:calcium-binding protein [Mesorhizobium silamurunense]|uniref:calcium-binding protein n=1 Tax=Mesorhizobium silamurunense TaxID=499528 RepID=UPI001785AF57|nr:calcium-binding protein [Mesorhizobium silamurunense]